MRYLGELIWFKASRGSSVGRGREVRPPLSVFSNDKKLLQEIKKIIRRKANWRGGARRVQNFKGEDNAIMKAIKEFKIALEKETGLPVFLEPEL